MKVIRVEPGCPGQTGARTHELQPLADTSSSRSAAVKDRVQHEAVQLTAAVRLVTRLKHGTHVTLLCPDGEVSSLGLSSTLLQLRSKVASAADPGDSSDRRETRRAHAVEPTTAAPMTANTCRHVSEGIPMVLSPSTR